MWLTDLCCSEEDLLRNVPDGAGSDAQAHPREDVGVVPLTGMESSPVRQRDGLERAPAGEDAPTLRKTSVFIHVSCVQEWILRVWSWYFCQRVALLGGTLSLAGWVAEGKDDWTLVEGSHISDDLLGEGSGDRCYTWDREPSPLVCLLHLSNHSHPKREREANQW